MTRSEERRSAQQVARTRQAIASVEAQIAAHAPEPPAGVHPRLHQAYREGLLEFLTELREDLAMLGQHVKRHPKRQLGAVLHAATRGE